MRSSMSDRNRQRLRTILTILVTALIIAPAAALATHGFNDVNDSDFYHAAVDWMKANDVTAGCNPPDNTEYCPDDPVTRGEMAVFFERLDSENVFVRPGDDAVDGGNADTVDGMHADDFLGANEQATDADTVDGKHASDFLGSGDKAADAELLDGEEATAFARNDAGLSLNANTWVPNGGVGNADIKFFNETVRVDSLGAGFMFIQSYAPVPVNVLGASLSLESVEYCYDATDAGITLDRVRVRAHETATSPGGSAATLETDFTARTDEACRTIALSTPEVIEGTETIYLQLIVDAAGAGDHFYIPRATFNYTTS